MYTIILGLSNQGRHAHFAFAYKHFFEQMQKFAKQKVTIHFIAYANWVEVNIPGIPPKTKLDHDAMLEIGKALGVVPFDGDAVPLPKFVEETAKQKIVEYVQAAPIREKIHADIVRQFFTNTGAAKRG